MKVLREDVISLATALGYKNATKWDKKRMTRKLAEVVGLAKESEIEVEEGTEDEEKLNALLAAMAASEEEVEIVTDPAEADEIKVVDEVDDDEDDDEDEDDEAEDDEAEEIDGEVEVDEEVEAKKKAKKDKKKGKKKEKKLTKKEVCIRMVSRDGGATLEEMGEEITACGVDPDTEKNTKTAKLWMPKIGFKVKLDKKTGKYSKAE